MNAVGGCWFALIGCVFALAGLACVLWGVSQFDEMVLPLSRHYVHRSSSRDGGWSYSGGFTPGALAYFGMLFVAAGVGVASLGARPAPATGRVIAAALALLWHTVGIGALWHYRKVAPQPDQLPFALFTCYEWLGLIPLGLAVPPHLMAGRLRSAVWNLMGGAFLGGVAGLLIGGVAGGVAAFVSSRHGGSPGGDWWLLGFCGGAALVGLAFARCRLAGWKLPTGDGSPLAQRPTPDVSPCAKDALVQPLVATRRSPLVSALTWLVALAVLGSIGFGAYTVRPCWRYEGKPTAHWLRQLKSPEAQVRAGAVKVLGGYARRPTRTTRTTTWDPQAIEPLVAALDDPEIRARYAAAQSLRSLVSRQPGLTQTEKAKIAAALLRHLRAQPDDDITAEYALASTGAPVVPDLVELIRAGQPPALRRKGAWALLYLASKPETVRSALPALREATQDADPKVREYATEALRKLDQPAEAPPPGVVEKP